MGNSNEEKKLSSEALWDKAFKNEPISKEELGNKKASNKSIYTLNESIEEIKHSDL